MANTRDLVDLAPEQFIKFLKKEDIPRFFLVYDQRNSRVISSHSQLQPIADFLQTDARDFERHEGLFFQVSRSHAQLQGVFVHRTNRGQGIGGLRYWHYETLEEFIRDGLRLSKGMTQKNALAGLWWGGGKGVIADDHSVDPKDPEVRHSVFGEFGEFVASLRGCYVTAEDVGTNVTDMASIFTKNRFVICIPQDFGGGGDPSEATARGVVCAMEAALEVAGAANLEGKTVAVQGIGNVATHLIGLLFERHVAKVVASDINAEAVQRAKRAFAGNNLEAAVVSSRDISILQTNCEILAPCATGAILNPRTIPLINARIVCGAANNQLEDSDRDGQALHNRGILYVPDFLANRMGIVTCANEQYGHVTRDPYIEQHLGRDWEYSVYRMTLKVLRMSQETNEPSAKTAVRWADELARQDHPIFGHRGQQIIASLVEDRWA